MRTIMLLFIILFGSSSFDVMQEEKYPFDQWDQATLKKAEAYTDQDKLSDLEKKVIFYCNLARLNPKLFAKTYAKQYLDDNEIKSSYSTSLIRDLNKTNKLDVIQSQKDLYTCAKNHAESNGKKGLIGHQNFSERYKKYAPQFRFKGENCDYGSKDALEVVMSLLIDEDVPGTGHRENILSKEYKFVGVAYAPHKYHEHNVVMCFGG